jgi:hypothetical protein
MWEGERPIEASLDRLTGTTDGSTKRLSNYFTTSYASLGSSAHHHESPSTRYLSLGAFKLAPCWRNHWTWPVQLPFQWRFSRFSRQAGSTVRHFSAPHSFSTNNTHHVCPDCSYPSFSDICQRRNDTIKQSGVGSHSRPSSLGKCPSMHDWYLLIFVVTRSPDPLLRSSSSRSPSSRRQLVVRFHPFALAAQ